MANLLSINELDPYTMQVLVKELKKVMRRPENQIPEGSGPVRVNATITLDITGQVKRGESHEYSKNTVNWESAWYAAQRELVRKSIGSDISDDMVEMIVDDRADTLHNMSAETHTRKGPTTVSDSLVCVVVPEDKPVKDAVFTSWEFIG